MPKRTNEFQNLIGLIYRQLSKVDNAKVLEPAMVKDRETGDDREIDCLLECQVAGLAVNIAVECRDHKRKGDMTWIDQIVGKYKSLKIDRIVAVSRAGFTKGAIKRAEANRIECKTLVEAKATDWPAEFIKIGLATMVRTDLFVIAAVNGEQVAICIPEELTVPSQLEFTVEKLSGEPASLNGLAQRIYIDMLRDLATNHYKDNFRRLFPTLADCNQKINVRFPKLEIVVSSVKVVDRSGNRSDFELTDVSLLSIFTYEKSAVSQELLSTGEALATKGMITESGDEQDMNVTVVQSLNSRDSLTVQIKPSSRDVG